MILNQETMKPKLAKKQSTRGKDAKVQQKVKKLGKDEDPNMRC